MWLLADQSSNAKLSKNLGVNDQWQTSILYLSPSDSSGLTDRSGRRVNLCPAASAGCKSACLNTAGRGVMSSVQLGRLRKTKLYVEDRAEFNRQLISDLETISRRQQRSGIKQAVRLNGTSDIAWEDHAVLRDGVEYRGVPQAFPELQFYDYTKLVTRVTRSQLDNYHLTFSRSEVNDRATRYLNHMHWNVNIAIVFLDKLPDCLGGRVVIDGTAHDMRFLDPPGAIVGLLAKGKAKRDDTGFAIPHTGDSR